MDKLGRMKTNKEIVKIPKKNFAFPREKKELRRKRVHEITNALRQAYPDVRCALHFATPMELLVATILSAQCTDKRVNMVTPALFKKFPDTRAFSKAKEEDVEKLVKSTGFYKNKAKNICAAARRIMEQFRGEVPRTMDDLVSLPGVGRKTANVILGNAYDIPGIPVDTHMIRVNGRLGITRNTDPVKIEFDLMPLLPEKDWVEYSHLIIEHGRNRCFARKPDCPGCEIRNRCPSRDIVARL